MTILKVLTDYTNPDSVLKKVAEPVEEVNDEIRAKMDDMLETMYAKNGCGLAATQVGIEQRIIVMDVSSRNQEEAKQARLLNLDNPEEPSRPVTYPLFMVNPVITAFSKEKIDLPEGCLSIPGKKLLVNRPESLEVEFLDYYGNRCKIVNAHEWLSRVTQHEEDHLDGRLMTERDVVGVIINNMVFTHPDAINMVISAEALGEASDS